MARTGRRRTGTAEGTNHVRREVGGERGERGERNEGRTLGCFFLGAPRKEPPNLPQNAFAKSELHKRVWCVCSETLHDHADRHSSRRLTARPCPGPTAFPRWCVAHTVFARCRLRVVSYATSRARAPHGSPFPLRRTAPSLQIYRSCPTRLAGRVSLNTRLTESFPQIVSLLPLPHCRLIPRRPLKTLPQGPAADAPRASRKRWGLPKARPMKSPRRRARRRRKARRLRS